jgi:hypothetical protein
VHEHEDQIEQARVNMVADAAGSPDVHDWVSCLVRPLTEHLADHGPPQLVRAVLRPGDERPGPARADGRCGLTSIPLRMLLMGLNQCRPDLPANVCGARCDIARHSSCRRAASGNAPSPRAHPPSNRAGRTTTSLIDAITGL